MMRLSFRAHFDGKVIVPDEPANLPVGSPLSVTVDVDDRYAPRTTPEERRAAYDSLIRRIRSRRVPHLSDEAISRESMYEDR